MFRQHIALFKTREADLVINARRAINANRITTQTRFILVLRRWRFHNFSDQINAIIDIDLKRLTWYIPTEQTRQSVPPDALMKKPGAQALHLVAPFWGWIVPKPHLMQLDDELDGPWENLKWKKKSFSVEIIGGKRDWEGHDTYRPEVQFWQLWARLILYWPAGHMLHLIELSSAYFPGSQSWHEEDLLQTSTKWIYKC